MSIHFTREEDDSKKSKDSKKNQLDSLLAQDIEGMVKNSNYKQSETFEDEDEKSKNNEPGMVMIHKPTPKKSNAFSKWKPSVSFLIFFYN